MLSCGRTISRRAEGWRRFIWRTCHQWACRAGTGTFRMLTPSVSLHCAHSSFCPRPCDWSDTCEDVHLTGHTPTSWPPTFTLCHWRSLPAVESKRCGRKEPPCSGTSDMEGDYFPNLSWKGFNCQEPVLFSPHTVWAMGSCRIRGVSQQTENMFTFNSLKA